MYNFKDKAVHVRALLRERFADTDKEILRAVSPDHPEALSLRHSSTRHEIILHALLDIITREEIERKREEIIAPLPSQEGENAPSDPADGKGEKESTDPKGKDVANEGLKEQVKDIADQTDDIQTRVEDLESQVSGLSDDLNEEKKSEKRPVKPKKKPSTH